MSQKDLDNRANQKNPNHWRYWNSRGYPTRPYNWRELLPDFGYVCICDTHSRNNRANQNNPNHIRYWKSRGHFGRPSNWKTEIDSDEYESEDELESSYSSGVAVSRTNSTVALRNQVVNYSDDSESEDEMPSNYSSRVTVCRTNSPVTVCRTNSPVTVRTRDTSSDARTALAWVGGGLLVGAAIFGIAVAIKAASERETAENRLKRNQN